MPQVRGFALPRQYASWSFPDLGKLTVARAAAYERVEGDGEIEVAASDRSALADAAEALPVFGAELALWPGPVEAVTERFRRRHPRGLVLAATAEPNAGTAISG